MSYTTIGKTVLEKTGTTITKRLVTGFGEGEKLLETTIQYGKNTPMVKSYGIDKVVKTKIGNSTNISFNRGDTHLFSVQSLPNGAWCSAGGAHYASKLAPLGKTKELIKNHLAMFKATLGLK